MVHLQLQPSRLEAEVILKLESALSVLLEEDIYDVKDSLDDEEESQIPWLSDETPLLSRTQTRLDKHFGIILLAMALAIYRSVTNLL